jgi:anaerobic ribonucleoside-triphosphate reductase
VTQEERQVIEGKIKLKEKEEKEVKGTECEVFARVCGFFTPVKQWNKGKAQEFKERVTFDESVKK